MIQLDTSNVRPWLAIACLSLVACGQSSVVTPAGSGGSGPTGATGGTATGGQSATGGSSTGGTGDPIGTGGVPTSGSGGDLGAGGTISTGGTTGNSGGSPGTAGRGGSSASGGSGGSGGGIPTATCPAGALFCEDFETFAAMAPPNGKWTSRTNGTATVMVDATHAHSGTKAVHFHSSPVNNGQRAYILTQGAPAFPVAGDKVYVRFMMYIERYMSVTGMSIHNRIAWIGSAATLASGNNGPGFAFVTYNGIAVERLTDPHQGFQRDTSQHMDDASRQGKWQCFEFEIDNKGGVPAGELAGSTVMPHIWQEGQELKLGAGGTPEQWLPAPFEALQFSLWCPQTDPMPTDYWIDDIVMSTSRIGCPTAP